MKTKIKVIPTGHANMAKLNAEGKKHLDHARKGPRTDSETKKN